MTRLTALEAEIATLKAERAAWREQCGDRNGQTRVLLVALSNLCTDLEAQVWAIRRMLARHRRDVRSLGERLGL